MAKKNYRKLNDVPSYAAAKRVHQQRLAELKTIEQRLADLSHSSADQGLAIAAAAAELNASDGGLAVLPAIGSEIAAERQGLLSQQAIVIEAELTAKKAMLSERKVAERELRRDREPELHALIGTVADRLDSLADAMQAEHDFRAAMVKDRIDPPGNAPSTAPFEINQLRKKAHAMRQRLAR